MADKFIKVGARDNDGVARPLQQNKNKSLEVIEVHEDEKVNVENASSSRINCKNYNSLVLRLEDVNGEFYFSGVQGQVGDGDWMPLNMISENLVLVPPVTKNKGLYYVNLVGLDRIMINRLSSSFKYNATMFLTSAQAPHPLDTAIKYQRIRASDGEITGNFRAIEPITDITLSPRIRPIQSYAGDVQTSPFSTKQTRLAGQPLYGPFDRVKIESGEALLVLMDV